MDISVFVSSLRDEIVKLGIPEDAADRYIETVRKNITRDDIAKITESDISKFAKVCVSQISKKSSTATPTAQSRDTNTAYSIPAGSTVKDSSGNSTEEEYSEIIPAESAPPKASGRGTAMLVLITVLSSPLWIAAAALFLAPFLAIFAVEIALIAAFVCLLAGFSAAGTAASLTGIVYGIVKMFSTPAVGLYEIGFGVIIAGVTMICGILIYNGTVRLMPWLIKTSARLLRFTFSKVKPLLSEYKRRCEKL